MLRSLTTSCLRHSSRLPYLGQSRRALSAGWMETARKECCCLLRPPVTSAQLNRGMAKKGQVGEALLVQAQVCCRQVRVQCHLHVTNCFSESITRFKMIAGLDDKNIKEDIISMQTKDREDTCQLHQEQGEREGGEEEGQG